MGGLGWFKPGTALGESCCTLGAARFPVLLEWRELGRSLDLVSLLSNLGYNLKIGVVRDGRETYQVNNPPRVVKGLWFRALGIAGTFERIVGVLQGHEGMYRVWV